MLGPVLNVHDGEGEGLFRVLRDDDSPIFAAAGLLLAPPSWTSTISTVLARSAVAFGVFGAVAFAVVSSICGIGCCLRLGGNELVDQAREGIPRRWDQKLRKLGTNEVLAVVLEDSFGLGTAESDDPIGVDCKDHIGEEGQDESLPPKLGI